MQLVRSVDEFKDQTYFIYNIKQEQLAHILFPIGKFKKTQVREMARKFKLPNAERKESMGLCFVGKIRLDQFLSQKVKTKLGKILDTSGKILGQHRGVQFYTLGQREGLGIGGTGPYYVVAKDLKANTLTVSSDPKAKEFLVKEVQLSGTNWIAKNLKFPLKCKGRFRHQQKLLDIQLQKQGKDLYKAKFKLLQSAVSSGQSLVLYRGKECIGGGVIA